MDAPSRGAEPPGTRKLLAELCAERLSAPDACRWAVSALEAGFDTPSLRLLAGASLDPELERATRLFAARWLAGGTHAR